MRYYLENATKIFLLENIRFFSGETKNDKELSKQLGSLCDIFVNDAFGTSHRAHSSTVGITEFVKKVAGFLLKKKLMHLLKPLFKPVSPICLVVGGAKVKVQRFLFLNNIAPKVNKIIIGGAMSNTFLKALGNDMQSSLRR